MKKYNYQRQVYARPCIFFACQKAQCLQSLAAQVSARRETTSHGKPGTTLEDQFTPWAMEVSSRIRVWMPTKPSCTANTQALLDVFEH